MKHLASAMLLSAAALIPSLASATVISASFDVGLNDADPGLVVNSQDIADNPFSFDLNEGESTTFDLFSIWTDESSVNDDDQVARPISVDFDFLLPYAMSGSVNGDTSGQKSFSGFYQSGELTWDGALNLTFGDLNDGLISIELSDETFNDGAWWSLYDGYCYGARVQATITLVSDATPASVPEPGSLALMGLGLFGISLRARRRLSSGH